MNSKTHRQNHDFQILYFLVGACHTPDGAYALLCDLYEDRKQAVDLSEVAAMRNRVARAKIAARIASAADDNERLLANADLLEMRINLEMHEKNVEAAKDELAFLEKCMTAIEPYRKFKHLSLREAHEAAQYDEWKFELLSRAENSLITTGGINAEDMKTLRMHPAFASELLPALDHIRQTLSQPGGAKLLLTQKTQRFDLPKLIAQ